MRIAVDVSYIQRKRAGIGRYTINLLDALLDADRENEYLLLGWSFSLDRKKIISYSQPNVYFRLAQIPGALRRYYWTRLSHPRLDSLTGGFDIFHSADALLPPLGGEPAIITVYDLAYRRFPKMFEEYVLRLDKYVRRAIGRAEAIIVPSEFTKADFLNAEAIDQERVHVIRPALRPVKTGESESPSNVLEKHRLTGPYILSVGTIEPRKNHVNLVQAFEEVARHDPDLQLVIVGKLGWHYNQALEAMETSPAAGRIRYLQYVPDADLEALYRGARCMVYPSFFEGGGLPVLEAMRSGTPVVTSESSAMKEVASGAAILVNPGDPGDIAEGTMKILGDQTLAEELSRKGRDRVKEFSPESTATKLLALYRSLS